MSVESIEAIAAASRERELPLIRHGFADYMRDYELVVFVANGAPLRLIQFIGCVSACVTSTVDARVWRESFAPTVGEFNWDVRYSTSNWGVELVKGADGDEWAKRLGMSMHVAEIVTETHRIRLVFHDMATSELPLDYCVQPSEPIEFPL